jgi:hypothetical protein
VKTFVYNPRTECYRDEQSGVEYTRLELDELQHVPGFSLNWDEPMLALILDEEVSHQAFRLFALIVAKMDIEKNELCLTFKRLQMMTGWARSSLLAHMAILKQKQIIFHVRRAGHTPVFIVNPHIAFKGSATNKKKVLRYLAACVGKKAK